MTLDHSSIGALMADLKQYRKGVFRFELKTYGIGNHPAADLPWRLVDVSDDPPCPVFMEFIAVPVGDTDVRVWHFGLKNGWLSVDASPHAGGTTPMRVQLMNVPRGGFPSALSDPDGRLRKQLDGNLKGVFS